MGWRYRKSKKLPGGFRINYSKSGIGYSWGTKHYRITKTANGRIRQTRNFGHGLSYVTESSGKSRSAAASIPQNNKFLYSAYGDKAYKKTTAQLANFKYIMVLGLCMVIIGALMFQNVIACSALITAGVLICISRITIFKTEIPVSDKNSNGKRLLKKWAKLSQSEFIWQIDSDCVSETPRVLTQIEYYNHRPYVKCKGDSLCIRLAYGQMIINEGNILLYNGYKAGIINAKDLTYTYYPIDFTEEDCRPKDCIKLATRYKYINKDGSPDQRRKNNPVVAVNRYGRIDISAPTGLYISLMISNDDLAKEFVQSASKIYADT